MVLAVGAGAGDLAPKLPFLPVLTKNRHGKDTACSVRQWGVGDACTDSPTSQRVRPSPQVSSHMPLPPQPFSAVAITGPGSRMGCGAGFAAFPKVSVNVLIGVWCLQGPGQGCSLEEWKT